MINKFRDSVTINISVSFLFFAFLIVGCVFICTDTEYNLNQQMSRGYITSDAVFFDFENPAVKPYGYDAGIFYDDEHNSEITLSIKQYDPDFVLQNKTMDDGFTSVETLLTSCESDYFVALHRDTMRAVFYRGKLSLPPITNGRFFTEDECLSDKCYAVVGKNLEKDIYKVDNKSYLDYLGHKYEVLGITGVASKSALDSIIFVNIGSLTPEEQLNGMFYIDCSKDNKGVYNDIAKNAKALFGCELKNRKTPIAFIDIASGEMYMKNYLFVIMIGLMIFAYLNTLVQYIERQRLKISIMKLCGTKIVRIIKETGKSYILDCLFGIVMGIIGLLALLFTGFFVLEYSFILDLVLKLSCVSLSFSILGYLLFIFSVVKMDPQKVIRQV